MSGTNDFLAYASGGSPNVTTQSDYAASSARTNGVVAGTADPMLANKAWRQGNNMAAAIGAFIAARNYDALDDGDVPTLRAHLEAALAAFFGIALYATAGGTANALTATLSPAPTALSTGMAVYIGITTANTAAATLNLNGLGAKAIVRHNGTAIGPGELAVGAIETLIYDGTSFRITAPPTKARYWSLKTSTGTIPASVETRMASWGTSASNMPASTVNASAGTITIGAADAGVYVVSTGAAVTSATIVDIVGIRVNGTDALYQSMQSPSDVTAQDPTCAGILILAAGDVVDATYYQVRSAGGSNTLVGTGNYFNGVRIGD